MRTAVVLFTFLVFNFSTFAKADATPSFKSLGLREGGCYQKERAKLLKKGFKSKQEPAGEKPTFDKFPEIVCGHGVDATCSALFIKNGEEMRVGVDLNKKCKEGVALGNWIE